MVKTLLTYKLSKRIGKKSDLSDFQCLVVVGARQAGLSISETARILMHSHLLGLHRVAQRRENIQAAAVVWTKMPC